MTPSLFRQRNTTPQNIPLQNIQTVQVQRALIEEWFVKVDRPDGRPIDDNDFDKAHRSFEERLKKEAMMSDPVNTPQNPGQATKCELVTETIKLIREDCRVKRSKLDSDLRTKYAPSTEHVAKSIDRALRLFLAINSRNDGSRVNAPETPWPQNGHETLFDFVRRLFLKSTFAASNGTAALTDHADATSAQQRLTHRLTAGWKIFPNLLEAQHSADTTKHEEAERSTVGQNHEEGHPASVSNTTGRSKPNLHATNNTGVHNGSQKKSVPLGSNFMIPVSIIDETIATLDYLFPQDKATDTFLREEETRHGIAINVLPLDRPTHRTTIRLKDFNYYHDRMLDVAYEFTNPPTSWSLVWKDRRNPVQFWTFWLGLGIFGFTILFGILASAYAGLQYKVAVQTLHADAAKATGSRA